MMVHKQDLPLILRLAIARALASSSLLDHGSRGYLPISKGSGITGILQHLTDSSAARQRPYDFPPRRAWLSMRDRNLLFAKPNRRLPSASQLPKFLEDVANRLLHLTIRSLLNAAVLADVSTSNVSVSAHRSTR